MARLDVVTSQTELEPDPQVPGSAPDAPAGSVLARLRARAALQRHERTLDLPVGGDWGDDLILRYRQPSMEDADRLTMAQAQIGQAATGSGGNSSFGRWSVDVMTTCCQTALGVADDGSLLDLKVGLNGQLLQMLGAELPAGVDDPDDATASEVIGRLFSGSWMGINTHAMQVVAWLQGGGPSLGEGSSGT